jgi:hypothetical protein
MLRQAWLKRIAMVDYHWRCDPQDLISLVEPGSIPGPAILADDAQG